MSVDGKKGLFGRLFGGSNQQKQNETVVPQEDVISAIEDAALEDEALNEESEREESLHEEKVLGEKVQEEIFEDTFVDDAADASEEAEGQADVEGEDKNEQENEQDNDTSGDVKQGWFSRLKSGLSKSSSKLSSGITGIFTKSKLDDESLQDLEDLLIQSDLGVAMAMRITDKLSQSRYDKEISAPEIRQVLAEEVTEILTPVATPLVVSGQHKPHILLMVGVNGAGKTTTIGKLAQKFKGEGKSVMLAAGDTFRAAAIEQLKVWSERTGALFVASSVGSDASGLVFDALQQAKSEKVDVLMIDTAGRLQNKTHLMDELQKIVRVIKKFDETGPHDVLLTLDATTGQNALNQVDIFQKTAGVTGLIMTKLDGSARGGILVAIAEKFKLPIHAIGVGESIEDMQPFEPIEFARAIADLDAD